MTSALRKGRRIIQPPGDSVPGSSEHSASGFFSVQRESQPVELRCKYAVETRRAVPEGFTSPNKYGVEFPAPSDTEPLAAGVGSSPAAIGAPPWPCLIRCPQLCPAPSPVRRRRDIAVHVPRSTSISSIQRRRPSNSSTFIAEASLHCINSDLCVSCPSRR